MEVEDRRFALLVQWRPERMSEEHYTKLFGALVAACRTHMEQYG